MNLFGRKKKKNIDTQPQFAIQKLRESLSTLEKRESHLEKSVLKLKADAKIAIQTKNKKRALYHLKRASLAEKQILNIYNVKFNLETQLSALEQTITNQETIAVLSIGKSALSQAGSKVNTDQVDDLVDDIAENIALVDEVSETMARPINPVDEDEDLLAEFEAELAEGELGDLVKPPDLSDILLPVAPVGKLAKVSDTEEEEELRQLNAMMTV